VNLALQVATFRGFRSFLDEFVLTLDKGPLFLFGRNEQYPEKFGSNGAGKSTVALAICWCLTGRLPMKVPKDEVINRQSDECLVEVRMADLLVRRSKKRGYAESLYWKASDGREGKGELAEVQRSLTEILGIDSTLFFNSLWFDGESKTVQFLFAQDSQRMEILEGLLAQNLFANARRLAAGEHTEAKHRLSVAESGISSIQTQQEKEEARRGRAEAALAEYDERIARAEERRDKRRGEIVEESASLREQYAEHRRHYEALEDVSRSVGGIEEDLQEKRAEIATLTASHTALLRLASLREGSMCPTCGQNVTKACAAPAARDLPKIEKARERAQEEEQAILLALTSARRALREVEAAGVAMKPLVQRVKALKAEDERLQEAVDYESRTALAEAVRESKHELHTLVGKLQALENAKAAAKQDAEVWAFWVEGFGSKGLRTIMLDKVRVMMQHHVDQYTLRLAGEAFRVRFPTSKSGFDIVLETADGPVPVESFSKGEVWRANLAVLLSLRKVLQYMKATPLNFLILDDPCSGSVDDVGADSIVETIIAISEEFDQVFCTLPKEVAVPYDRALMVIKDKDGFSEVEAYTA